MNLLVNTKDFFKKKNLFPIPKRATYISYLYRAISIECTQSYFLKPTHEIQRLYRH